MRAALFPGQGVHKPGMGSWAAGEQRQLFSEASDALRINMAELCKSGVSGEADLRSTRWAQPAILVCGVAAALTLAGRGAEFDMVSGHSLGEYTALVAAGALTVTDGVRLVSLRAEAMERACARTPGTMAAVLNQPVEVVEELCRRTGAVIAGDNAPGQVVVAGTLDAVDLLVTQCRTSGYKSTRLNVAGAFHSPAMADAIPTVAAVLGVVPIQEPAIDFWSPTAGGCLSEPDSIRKALIDQLTCPVLWRPTVAQMANAGASEFIDMGPGKVLANMVKRIVSGAQVLTAEEVS